MQKHLKYLVPVLLISVIVGGLTYYLIPAKVVIKEVEIVKEVEVVREVKVFVRDVDRKKTTEREVKPDGTIIEKIIEVDKSKEASKEVGKKETTVAKSKRSTTKKEFRKDKWEVYGGVLTPPLEGFSNPVFVGGINRSLFGTFSVGVIGTSDKKAGFTIGFKF